MTDIGPGDYVLCVDAESPGANGSTAWESPHIATGAYYWVSDAFVDALGRPVILVGWERKFASANLGYRVGYGLFRFRKITSGGEHLDVRQPEKVSA